MSAAKDWSRYRAEMDDEDRDFALVHLGLMLARDDTYETVMARLRGDLQEYEEQGLPYMHARMTTLVGLLEVTRASLLEAREQMLAEEAEDAA